MSFDLRIAIPSVGIAAIATVLVIVRVVGAPSPEKRPNRATREDLRDFALTAAREEPAFWRHSIQDFPEDNWSARDDFHAREMKHLEGIAGERKVPIEDVLRAIDDDIHELRANADSPDVRGARAIPCKPRPFYD